jgi:hypothetical protein
MSEVLPPSVLFSDAFFSDVKVQVEAEDTAMMQQLKSDDFVILLALVHMCSATRFCPSS